MLTRLVAKKLASARSAACGPLACQSRWLSVSPKEQDSEPDLFENVQLGKSDADSGFSQWYDKIKKDLKNSQGPYWLGGKTPFPYNKEFKPARVLENELKNRLMALYDQDPTTFTPRKLSSTFKISIERIQAIIKLKLLEKSLVSKGYSINEEYLKAMEETLGASSLPANLTGKDDASMTKDPTTTIRPSFVSVPEGSTFTPMDAARRLKRRLKRIQLTKFPNQDEPEDRTELEAAKSSEGEGGKELTISIDQYEQGRHCFVFVDSSSNVMPKDRQVLIREPSGELRHASKKEKLGFGRRIWGLDSKKFIQ